jgi:hypothetical protein
MTNRITHHASRITNCLFLAVALLLYLTTNLSAQAPADLPGNWLGTLSVEQTKLRLLFKISKNPEGSFAASLDSLDQGANDIPVDDVTFKDNTLRLEIKLLKGAYEGTLDSTGDKVEGTWTQAGQSLPLTLERTKGSVSASGAETLSPENLTAGKVAAQKLGGTWTGTLMSGAAQIPLTMSVGTNAEGLATGTMASPQQGLKNIPLSTITYKDGQTHFEARGLAATYDGVSFNNSTSMTGQWHQAGQTLPLNFRKTGVK